MVWAHDGCYTTPDMEGGCEARNYFEDTKQTLCLGGFIEKLDKLALPKVAPLKRERCYKPVRA